MISRWREARRYERTRSGICYLRSSNDDAGTLGHVRYSSSSEEEGPVDVGLEEMK